MIRSLSIMVFKRCAIVMTVHSLKLLLIVSWIKASVLETIISIRWLKEMA